MTTVEELVGQLIIGSIKGTIIDRETAKDLAKLHISGIFLSPENMPEVKSISRLTEQFQAQRGHAGYPGLVAIDQEGGRIQPLPDTTPNFPSAAIIGYTRNAELAYQWALMQGQVLRSLGINTTFSPCLDVVQNKENRGIGSRSFGSDPKLVSAMGKAALRGFRDAGVLAVVKHFPGHGDTSSDPHYGPAHVAAPRELVWERDILPFRTAVKSRASAIMTAHLIYDNIDPKRQATISYTILTGILRRKMGFRGAIVSDALVMDSMAKDLGIGAAAVAFINAGGDVLEAHGSWREAYFAVLKAVKDGKITGERLAEAAHHALRLRERIGILQQTNVQIIDEESRYRLLTEISLQAQANGAPLDEDDDLTLLPGTARRFHLSEELKRIGGHINA